MRGTIRHVHRPGHPGSWTIRYSTGDRPLQRCPKCTDERRRPSRWWLTGRPLTACPRCGGELIDEVARQERVESGFRIKRDAQDALVARLAAIQGEADVAPDKVTFGEYLTREWLPGLASTLRPLTISSYRSVVVTHVLPTLGSVPLQKLTAGQLDQLYAGLLTTPRSSRDGSKPLMASTVQLIHVIIHRALKDAVRKGRRVSNPADSATPPRSAQKRQDGRNIWTGDQLGAFLEATSAADLGPLWDLMANTGVRRGEALGLRWGAVDFDAGRISIQETIVPGEDGPVTSAPKTRSSRRTVPLAPEATEALREQARRQANAREKADTAWSAGDFVFTDEIGRPLDPDWTSHEFAKAVRATRLPYCRLHDLRHGFATRALAAGVHPKVVQQILGHASVSITLDLYSHAIPGMDEAAVTLIAAQIVRPSRDSR